MRRFLLSLIFLFLLYFCNGQIINEFEPNPAGADPSNVTIELKGTANNMFSGVLLSIENDGINGTIDRRSDVSGTFDMNGIATVIIPDLENPSFTLVFSELSPPIGTDLDGDNNGVIDDLGVLGTIYDAIGIADSPTDFTTLYANQLGGLNFPYTGEEPPIMFRDPDFDRWFAVNTDGSVLDQDENNFNDTDFVPNASMTTFGVSNPVNTTLSGSIINIEAKKTNNGIIIRWETINEIENDYFDIEWSDNYSSYKTLTKIKCKNEINNIYEFFHKYPTEGINYYRISQIDLDGIKTVFPTKSIYMDTKSTGFSILPNRVSNNLKIKFDTPVENGRIQIFDNTGKLIINQLLGDGIDILNTDVSGLTAGQYIIRYVHSGGSETNRFVKL